MLLNIPRSMTMPLALLTNVKLNIMIELLLANILASLALPSVTKNVLKHRS